MQNERFLKYRDTSFPDNGAEDRKKDYFNWAKAVVDNLRGTHQGLEMDFDKLTNSTNSK